MKTKLPWMVAAAALLAACDEKQEPAAAAPQDASTTKRFSPSSLPKPKPQAATPPAPGPAPSAPPVAQQTPPPAAPPAAPATPPPAAAPALSAEEREAQRAEQRQQRIARVSEGISSRLKSQDANGDGLLTEDELTGPMQRGFSRADTNNDGALDAAEQQAMVQGFAERIGNFDRGGDRNDRRGSDRRSRGGGGGFGSGRRRGE